MFNSKKNEQKKARIEKIVNEIANVKSSKTDPQGMYTGVPINPYEKPIQDADDL